ncbi:MAG: hypothetical protein K6E87_06495 [bacterium]|nr:hypothetical protein [bacterium]
MQHNRNALSFDESIELDIKYIIFFHLQTKIRR